MLIDWTRIQELRDEIGGDGFAEVVAIFLDESDAVIAAGANGFAEDALHFLRGAALNLGFSELANACSSATAPEKLVALYLQSKQSLLAEAT